jgi:hypothetical protein
MFIKIVEGVGSSRRDWLQGILRDMGRPCDIHQGSTLGSSGTLFIL